MGNVVEGHVGDMAHLGAPEKRPDLGARCGVQGTSSSVGGLVVLVRQCCSTRVLGPTSGALTNEFEPLILPRTCFGRRATTQAPVSFNDNLDYPQVLGFA